MIKITLTDTLITVDDNNGYHKEIPVKVDYGLPIIDMSRDGSFIMIAERQVSGEKLLFATNDKFCIVRG